MDIPAIDVNELVKIYRSGGPRVVDEVSLAIPPGIVFGFLGPNGAGKTTTIKIMRVRRDRREPGRRRPDLRCAGVMTSTVIPIGMVRNGRTDPQDSDHWGDVESTILVEERFGDHCLTGLSDFSHVEIVYFFHQLTEREDYRKPLRPRGRADLPEVGVSCDPSPTERQPA